MSDDTDPLANYGPLAKPGKTVPPADVAGGIQSGQQNFLAMLAKAFGMDDAARAFRGEMTPEEAQMFALSAIPSVLAGPEGKVAEELAPSAARAIRAFHGSPYDFEKFDLSKIGTGEGAQAYGHGLYFAEQPGVAQQYKKTLSPPLSWLEQENIDRAWNRVAGQLKKDGFEPHKINSIIRDLQAEYQAGGQSSGLDAAMWPEDYQAVAAKAIQRAKAYDFDTKYRRPGGRMYEVAINADPEHFLDWDKPLSEQPQAVQDILGAHPQVKKMQAALTNNSSVGLTGGNAYTKARYGLDNKSSADITQQLRDAGIPGIKYLDQGSRFANSDQIPHLQNQIKQLEAMPPSDAVTKALQDRRAELAAAQKPTSNYVVFNDELIDIIRKYGLAGLFAGGGGAAALSGNKSRQ